jgi:hypothetical protein
MSGVKILWLLCVIAFAIGALFPAFFYPDGGPRAINWISLGLCFAAATYLLKAT